MTPVIRPPVRKEMRLGHRWAKSLAGLTTLAAMLVASVARHSANMEITSTAGFVMRASSTTGSQIGWP